MPVREMWDAATNFLHTRGLQLPFCPLDTLSPSLQFPSHLASPKLGFYSSKPNWLLVSGRSQCKGTRSLSSLLPSHPCPPPPPPPLLSPAHNFTHFSPLSLLLSLRPDRVKAEVCMDKGWSQGGGLCWGALTCALLCAEGGRYCRRSSLEGG